MCILIPPSPSLRNRARSPLPSLDPEFHGSGAPVLPVVVALSLTAGATTDAGPREGLVLIQDGQQTEDERHAVVELDAHETMRDGLGNVLEVHGLALDQDADGDEGIEGCG